MFIVYRFRLLLVLTTLLAACGGGGVEPEEPVLSASQLVGAAGGQLAVDGLELALPAGALTAETAVQVDRLPAEAGELARFRLGPAGLVLATAADLRIELPGAPASAALFWIVDGEPVLMPSTRTGDLFRTSLRSLGYTANARSQAAALPLRRQVLVDGDAPGGELSARPLDCESQTSMLRRRLQGLGQQGDIDEAMLVGNALQEVQLRCSSEQALQMRQAACTALQQAADAVRVTLPVSLPEITEMTQRLMGAEAAVQKAGAECNPVVDTGALVAQRFDAFLQVLRGQMQGGRFSTAAGLSEFQLLMDVEAQCQLLQIDAVCSLLREDILPDLLDAMRLTAFDDCRTSRSSALLAQLQSLAALGQNDLSLFDSGRYGAQDVAADMAYCYNPSLALKVFDDATTLPVELTDRAQTVRALGGLGNYTRRADIEVPRDGSLTIGGDILVTRCPDGSAMAAELVLRRGNQVVARRAHDGSSYSLGNSGFDVVVATLLSEAGLDPAATSAFTLTLTREGGTCQQPIDEDRKPLRIDPIDVFEINVALGAVGSFAGTVTLETSHDIRISATGEVDIGNCGFSRPPAVCRAVETAHLAASTRVELTLATAGELTLGRAATLQQQGITVTGAETGSRLREANGEGELCQVSGSSRLDASGPARRAETADWQLRVQPDGSLTLTPGAVRVVYELTNTGQSTVRQSQGCAPEGERTVTTPIGPAVSQAEGRLFPTDFAGTVNPADSVWQGEATRTFESQGAACLETLQNLAVLPLLSGVPQITCTATTRAIWRLVRQ